MTLSVCMIVRDEEAVIGRCLSGILPFADEVVVVDTGSRDATPAIASSLGARVYHAPWEDDFSRARNLAFSYAKTELLMWLDADDVVTSQSADALLRAKDRLPDGVSAVYLPYHVAFDEEGRPTYIFDRERIVRRTASPRWVGRVHETLSFEGRAVRWDIPIEHRSQKTVYSRRNLEIYESQARAGEPFSPRDLFYWGRELYYHGEYRRAIPLLDGMVTAGLGWVENAVDACRYLSLCYRALGDREAAYGSLLRALTLTPPRPNLSCEMGDLLAEDGKTEAAIWWYRTALACPDQTVGFIDVDASGYIPAVQLAVLYDRSGDRENALRYHRLSGTFRPQGKAYLHNEAYFSQTTPPSHTIE